MSPVTINASFGSQEQAESAVRKLRALRGDCFRIECHGASAQDDGLSSSHIEFAAEADLAGERVQRRADASDFVPEQTGGSSFTLSANIPNQAADQARRVIREAGGQVESAGSL